MIFIRPERKEDYERINEVNRKAYKTYKKSDERAVYLIEKLRNSPNFTPELSLVAVKDKQIVGHIFFCIVRAITNKGEIPAPAPSLLAVLPEFQKQGIGSLLLREGLKSCKRLGYSIVVVADPHNPDHYSNLGFKFKEGLRIFLKPVEISMVCEIKNNALRGIKESVVIYPPPFQEVLSNDSKRKEKKRKNRYFLVEKVNRRRSKK